MAEILRIKDGEEPSPYSNYVLVEQTAASTFQANGASNTNGAPDNFSPSQKNDLGEMLKIAVAWADSNRIHFVHVKLT